jgi:putative two-component system response regulator
MKTIFIVDDSETVRAAAKQALDGIYKTFSLPGAAACFKLLERITPDLILLDVDMPEMNGFEAIERLKSDERHKDIPVVFLTSMRDEDFEIRGLGSGALDFLRKPLSPSVLLKRAEFYIDTGERLRQSQGEQGEGALAIGRLVLDNTAMRAFLNGNDLNLSAKEYALLLLFAKNKGVVMGAAELYEKVWLRPLNNDNTALKATLSRLRSKLAGSGFSITSVYGNGYYFGED